MNTRLKAYLKYKNISVSETERQIGVGVGTLSKAFKGGKTIGSDKVEKILQTYPDLSAEWLMRGNGEMLLREEGETADKERIRMLEKQLEQVTRDKDNYWSLIQRLTEK